MQSMSGGQFSPIPKAMLDMLAKMTLEEEAEGSSNPTTAASTTNDTNTHNNQHNPHAAKRKFHRIQGTPQNSNVLEINQCTPTTKADLVDKVCLGS
ncbi:hypothetical protein TSUD_188510 [Trifolium subterraneum]|uniref:Uncharacterized protein n=1 Tax=Trifolium subterraneum TaxID=3900 RepID=A0A2Z6NE63_TRISU|nr:hypothetical protein TSUD_188510 [Trifolium subterraneum]